AARGPADGQTALAPTALGSVADPTTRTVVAVEPDPVPALAWSEADDDSGIMPIRAGEYLDDAKSAPLTASQRPAHADAVPVAADVWYRRPVVVAVGTALAVLAIGSGVMIALRHTSSGAPNAPTSGVNTAPVNPGTTDTETPVSSAPPSTASDTGTPSSTTSEAPTTTTTTQGPTSSTTPTTTETPSSTEGPRRPDRPRFPGAPNGPRLFQPDPRYR
ncbi:MAG: hypothetical protein WB777_14795, partial [Mycobacterium sp.]